MNIKQLALSACALTLSAQTSAALVVDQESLFQRSGGFSGLAAQSFLPSVNSISGIDVFMFNIASDNGSNTANLTAKLYKANGPEDFNSTLTPVLASTSILLDTTANASPFEGWAELRWGAVAITPESYYIITLTTDNGLFSVNATTTLNNPYSRGQFVEFNSFLPRDYFDLNFKTYYDDNLASAVPVPAAAWLFGSGLIGLVGIARRKNT